MVLTETELAKVTYFFNKQNNDIKNGCKKLNSIYEEYYNATWSFEKQVSYLNTYIEKI